MAEDNQVLCGKCRFCISIPGLPEADPRGQCLRYPPNVGAALIGIETDEKTGKQSPSYHFTFQNPVVDRSTHWCGEFAVDGAKLN